jgi:hypothetical protein
MPEAAPVTTARLPARSIPWMTSAAVEVELKGVAMRMETSGCEWRFGLL